MNKKTGVDGDFTHSCDHQKWVEAFLRVNVDESCAWLI